MYQTPADKAAERAIAAEVSRQWQCDAREFPEAHVLDYYLQRKDRMVAMMEIKRRPPLDKSPWLHLDWVKYCALFFAAQGHNVPGYYIAQCDDALVYIDVARLGGLRLRVIGREDRNNPNDVRPCLAIPVEWFRPVVRGGPAEGAGGPQEART